MSNNLTYNLEQAKKQMRESEENPESEMEYNWSSYSTHLIWGEGARNQSGLEATFSQ